MKRGKHVEIKLWLAMFLIINVKEYSKVAKLMLLFPYSSYDTRQYVSC